MKRMTGPGATAEATRGRPRDTRLDAAIAEAVFDLIAESGYNGLSIKAVAERAGTTTPTIYRRWSSKAELVLSIVFRTDGDDVVAETGDIEADVRTMIRWTLEKFGHPVGRAALAGLLGEPADDGRVVHEQLLVVWSQLGTRLRAARVAGDVRSDLDLEALIGALAGPAMLVAIVHGEAASEPERVERLAAVALDGMRVRSRPRRRQSRGSDR